MISTRPSELPEGSWVISDGSTLMMKLSASLIGRRWCSSPWLRLLLAGALCASPLFLQEQVAYAGASASAPATTPTSGPGMSGPEATSKPRSPLPGTLAVAKPSYAAATPAAVRKTVEERLLEALRQKGCQLVPASLAGKVTTVNLPPGCQAGPCLMAAGAKVSAQRLLVGGIGAVGNSYDLLFSLIDAPSGRMLAQVSRRCDVCTFAEVGRSVEQSMAELLRRGRRALGHLGRLVVRPQAPGLELWVDGVPRGSGAQQLLLAPGRHRLELRPNKSSATWGSQQPRYRGEVIIAAGARVVVRELPSALRASPAVGRPQGELQWPAWLAAGTASALLLGGVVTLALDEGCSSSGCGDRRDTTAAGLVLLGLGAGATVAAGLLIHHFRSSPAPKRRPAAAGLTFSAGPRGAALGYQGTF